MTISRGGEHGCQKRDFDAQYGHKSHCPNHADTDNRDTEADNPEGTEKQIKNNGCNQKRQGNEHIHLPLDVFCIDHPDVG